MIAWAMVFWFVLNCSVTLLNKAFFATMKAPYPMTITSVHLGVSGSFAALLMLATPRYGGGVIKWRTQKKLMAMSVLFTANIVVGNASLAYASVPFVSMVRCTIPVWTAVADVMLGRKSYTVRTWVSLIPIVGGAVMVTAGEIYLTPTGFFLTVLGCALCAAKAIATNMILVGDDKVGTAPTLRTVASLGCMELLPLSLYYETGFLSTWVPGASTGMIVLLGFHGAQAFMLNIANFEANKATSALVMTVAGNIKHVVTVLLSVVFFGSSLNSLGMVGVMVTIAGAFWYSMEKQGMVPQMCAPDTEEGQAGKDTGAGGGETAVLLQSLAGSGHGQEGGAVVPDSSETKDTV